MSLWKDGYYSAQNGVLAIANIPWSKYTHIIHFAAAPDSSGTVTLHYLTTGEMTDIIAARPGGKKVLVCLKDNDSDSSAFANATAPGLIATFVTNIAAFVAAHSYDGVDIDWEANINTTQYNDLISRLRTAMPSAIITSAMGNWGGLPSVAAASHSYLDHINVMNYDMDLGQGYSWYNDALLQAGDSSLSTTDWRMGAFTTAGVPVAKLGVGLPFYGRRWSGVQLPKIGGSFATADMKYRDLVTDVTRWVASAQRYDTARKANYLSLPTLNEFITYTGVEEIADILAWATAGSYGGVMAFTLDYEYLSAATGDAKYPLSTALAGLGPGGGGGGALAITTTSPLPAAQTGEPYSVTLTATGGTAPYTWEIQGGAGLPTGLSLNTSTGAITGTPTGPTPSTSFVAKVTDSAMSAATAALTISTTVAGQIIYQNSALWVNDPAQFGMECYSVGNNVFGGLVLGRGGMGQAYDGGIAVSLSGLEWSAVCVHFAVRTSFAGLNGGDMFYLRNWARSGGSTITFGTFTDGRVQIKGEGGAFAIMPGFNMIPGAWYFFKVYISIAVGGGTRTITYAFYNGSRLVHSGAITDSNTTFASVASFENRAFCWQDLIITDGEVVPECRGIVIHPNAAGDLTQLTGGGVVPRRADAAIDTGSSLYTNLVGLYPVSEGSGTTTKNWVDFLDNPAGLIGGASSWRGHNPTNAFNYLGNNTAVGTTGLQLNSPSTYYTDLSTNKTTLVLSTMVIKVPRDYIRLFGNVSGGGVRIGIEALIAPDQSIIFAVKRATTDLVVQTAVDTFTPFLGTKVQIAITWDGSVSPDPANVHIYINGIEIPKVSNITGSGAVAVASPNNFEINKVFVGTAGPTDDNFTYYAAIYKGRILSIPDMGTLDSEMGFPLSGGTPIPLHNYDYVRDRFTDNDASYLETDTVDNEDLWNMEDIGAGKIILVGGRTVHFKSGAGVASFSATTQVSGTKVVEPEEFPSYPSPLIQRASYRLNPVTGAEFTTLEVNDIQKGFKRIT